jgi:RimJ/RimL family protein N-acetyltransferase
VITSERVGLRARQESDVAILHAELYDDVATFARADDRPWVPINPASGDSPHAVKAATDSSVSFSVVELSSGDLAGEAILWLINLHSRSAHIGLSLRPSFQGRGLGTDSVRAMCRYGFDVRGLHRLQIETLADNFAMIGAAERCGFVREGQRRAVSWVLGEFVDEVILGLLVDEYRALPVR